jgi:hypothetical protein
LRANFKLVFLKNTKKEYKMKKFEIALLSTAALALFTVTGVNIHLNKIESSKSSDVTLKNIEALSGGEETPEEPEKICGTTKVTTRVPSYGPIQSATITYSCNNDLDSDFCQSGTTLHTYLYDGLGRYLGMITTSTMVSAICQ